MILQAEKELQAILTIHGVGEEAGKGKAERCGLVATMDSNSSQPERKSQYQRAAACSGQH